MRKLELRMDALEVESFPTGGARGEAGTVHGHDQTRGGDDTCWQTCGVTCPATCGDVCKVD